jgi:hypothetical protein
MGVRIFVGREEGDTEEQAILFCSSSGQAFGPFFESTEEAAMFLEWNPYDVRLCGTHDYDSIETHVFKFREARENGWKTKHEEEMLELEWEERCQHHDSGRGVCVECGAFL